MARTGFRLVSILVTLGFLSLTQPSAVHAEPAVSTDATYFNNAATPGADPFIRYDERSGYYYAYSTEGADEGHHFGVYRSPDMATWEKIPGGAIPANDRNQWADFWFWAPEVVYNNETGVYFLFYSGCLKQNVAKHFKYSDFEEPCKIGVATSKSPAGPFTNITNTPIDYYPYDPNYHDVNRLMGPDQKKPPKTLEEGRTAPLGTYIPMIDPNVFFENGKIYLYFSRNAYRNWVWDHDLGKYIEESNIYAVELTDSWWNDPSGKTMPRIHPRYRNATAAPQEPQGVRKDGFTPILDYGSDKQKWENAHVNDYDKTNGEKKDRRWAEGSSIIKKFVDGRPVYYLTYSANNYENEFYGVGYAVSNHPLGPWKKSDRNPILSQDESMRMYSTGHGSVASSPNGEQLYYPHHGRSSTTADRKIYTERMRFKPEEPDVGGAPALTIDQSVTDEPVPHGVAPFTITATRNGKPLSRLRACDGASEELTVTVHSASGAAFDLNNPLNRVRATLHLPGGAATVNGGHVRIHGKGAQRGWLTLTYQRQQADGKYTDVHNVYLPGSEHEHKQPVALTLPITAC